MTANSHRESAKIYQFPAGGRGGLRADSRVAVPAERVTPAPKVALGGSWYHDAAIQEATETPRKR